MARNGGIQIAIKLMGKVQAKRYYSKYDIMARNENRALGQDVGHMIRAF